MNHPRPDGTVTSGEKPVALEYASASPFKHHRSIVPAVLGLLEDLPPGGKVLDAGCGNGVLAGQMIARGFAVTGLDISESGIKICKQSYPGGTFHAASLCDPGVRAITGDGYDAVIAVEVIEHVYAPDRMLANCRAVLRDGGVLVITAPYHGYLKNAVLALSGRMDQHLQPGRTGGHIKFWSRRTLPAALKAAGFEVVRFRGYGRIPYLWKSMIYKAVKAG